MGAILGVGVGLAVAVGVAVNVAVAVAVGVAVAVAVAVGVGVFRKATSVNRRIKAFWSLVSGPAPVGCWLPSTRRGIAPRQR